ncbi:homologous-pairing protein-like protein 2 [Lineolata rhizophorae]|uniref:Homologous-pairing protein-like protein 2 n=1 Tax=Lineolata rhizophorae TaxID=578093 RepID=A0A6A6P5J1_9PEZI|nr:homologous-pairing protein-like protein 2 [Lineolata rhizophorae]
MAPRKEKAEKVTADEAVDTILSYLRQQNRPYSAIDISANLHNKVTKAAATKILKDLHEKQEIEGRAAGKQIVYHAKQDPSETASSEELASLASRIKELQTETAAFKAEEKTLRTSLTATNATLPTCDLRAAVASCETEMQDLSSRLTSIRSGTIRPVSAKEKNGVEAEVRKWEGIEKRRKRISDELWGLIAENVPEGTETKELREQLGLDE